MNHLVLLGCLGGLIPDVLRLLKLGEDGNYNAPDYLKKAFFYVILVLQILFGALMVYILPVHDNLQAIVYGYAAPQIFTTLAAGIIKRAGGGPTPTPTTTNEHLTNLDIKKSKNLDFKEAVNNFY